MLDAKEPGRRRIPHFPPVEIRNQSIIIFVTQVVAERRALLTRREAVKILLGAWERADRWQVGHYVIMPDHVHFFCAPVQHPAVPLKQLMGFWKAEVSRHWPWLEEKPIWQRDFFDRQLRSGESYSQKWHYIRENPLRAGLADADRWPWQGELNELAWHEP